MLQPNYRREFWQTIYAASIANAGPASSANSHFAKLTADAAIEHLNERFPAENATLWDEAVTQMGQLRAIVDQYSAQLADYRKGGPAKDIEIERLTREGLIKDQKLNEAADDYNKLLGDYNDKVCRIAELEKTITSLRQTMEVANDLRAQTISEKNDRIAELEAANNTTIVPQYAAEPGDDTLNSEGVNAPKRRTAIEWLEDLPEPYRSQALANAKNPVTSFMPDKVVDSLHDAVSTAVNEYNALEGRYYWVEVVRKLEKGEPLVNVDLQTGNATPLVKPEHWAAPSVDALLNSMEEPTTVKGWLELLEEPYRSQALENAEKAGTLYYERDSLVRSLNASFLWADSPQGHDYWREVELNLLKNG